MFGTQLKVSGFLLNIKNGWKKDIPTGIGIETKNLHKCFATSIRICDGKSFYT